MGDFSKRGVHKTDGFWNVFCCFYKLSARGVYLGKYGISISGIKRKANYIRNIFSRGHKKSFCALFGICFLPEIRHNAADWRDFFSGKEIKREKNSQNCCRLYSITFQEDHVDRYRYRLQRVFTPRILHGGGGWLCKFSLPICEKLVLIMMFGLGGGHRAPIKRPSSCQRNAREKSLDN